MSPTAPTFAALTDRLNKAHRRIRELEARLAELLAHDGAPGPPTPPQPANAGGRAL